MVRHRRQANRNALVHESLFELTYDGVGDMELQYVETIGHPDRRSAMIRKGLPERWKISATKLSNGREGGSS